MHFVIIKQNFSHSCSPIKLSQFSGHFVISTKISIIFNKYLFLFYNFPTF